MVLSPRPVLGERDRVRGLSVECKKDASTRRPLTLPFHPPRVRGDLRVRGEGKIHGVIRRATSRVNVGTFNRSAPSFGVTPSRRAITSPFRVSHHSTVIGRDDTLLGSGTLRTTSSNALYFISAWSFFQFDALSTSHAIVSPVPPSCMARTDTAGYLELRALVKVTESIVTQSPATPSISIVCLPAMIGTRRSLFTSACQTSGCSSAGLAFWLSGECGKALNAKSATGAPSMLTRRTE